MARNQEGTKGLPSKVISGRRRRKGKYVLQRMRTARNKARRVARQARLGDGYRPTLSQEMMAAAIATGLNLRDPAAVVRFYIAQKQLGLA